MRALPRWTARAALLLAACGSAGAAAEGGPAPEMLHAEGGPAPAPLHAEGGAAPAPLHAERISAERLDALRIPGPDSDAGVGDWALGNGTLCAAISDATHEGHLGLHGGTLIDLGPCGRGADQWSALQPLYDLALDWQLPVTGIRAAVERDRAWVEVVAQDAVLRATTRFAVAREPADALRVTQRIERVGPGRRLFAVGHVAITSSAQLRPFALSLADPEASPGFAHREIDTGSPLSLVRGVVPVDAHVLVGGDRIAPRLSYGLRLDHAHLERPGRPPQPVPTFTITGADFAMLAVMTGPPWIGSDTRAGLLELAQMPLLDLAPGHALELEQVLWLGRRADVASVADALYAQGPRLEGRVDDASSRVHVTTRAGAPVSEVRPDADGRFALRLPAPGVYRLRAVAPGGREAERELEVPAGGAHAPPLSLGTPARLVLPREWMRIALRGLDGTPDPLVGDDLLGLRSGERTLRASTAASVVSIAGVEDDPREVRLAPGRYRAIATRGPEYGVSVAELTLRAGERRTLDLPPPARALEAPGFVAADLHVHSAESFDSALPLADQLRAFAAHGTQLVVSTEHDRAFDPRPGIEEQGLSHRLVGVPGVEATTTVPAGEAPFTIGHSNVFPWPDEPGAYRRGAPLAEGRRLRDLAHRVRTRGATGAIPILQLNHARANDGRSREDLYYFSHLGVVGEPFDPGLPLSAAPNHVLLEPDPEHGLRDLSFDAMELLNGTERGRYALLRADWISLLLQGERVTATANSDSHEASEIPGLPRTYLRLAERLARGHDPGAALAETLRAGQAFGTTGPLLDVRLEGRDAGDVGIGGTFAGREATLHVVVQAAPWVPVNELRVLVDGELAYQETLEEAPGGPGGSAPLRLERRVPLAFARDAFVVVEAEGPARGLYAELHPGLLPLAFSNPIWVDADGDGRLQPPGLPEPLPWAIRQVRR